MSTGTGTPGTRFWPLAPFATIAVAVALFAAPPGFEGPVLVPISPGHALSVLDTLALLPLVLATGWLYAGLWARRRRLGGIAARTPGSAALVIFAGGTGLGMLLASAFSTFFWWWAIGAMLFGLTVVVASVAASRPELPARTGDEPLALRPSGPEG